MDSFWDLDTERQIGMGLGPIPWSKTVKYGLHAGLSRFNVNNIFVPVMRKMDRAYLEWQGAQLEKSSKKQTKNKTIGNTVRER